MGRLKSGPISKVVRLSRWSHSKVLLQACIYQTNSTNLVEGSGVHKYSGQKKKKKLEVRKLVRGPRRFENTTPDNDRGVNIKCGTN